MVKEDFIVGKWYKNFIKRGVIVKFLKIDKHNRFIGSEWIESNKHHTGEFSSTAIIDLIECSINEYKHVLPKNHPDLINITPKIYELW
jgi:hypothetical protein